MNVKIISLVSVLILFSGLSVVVFSDNSNGADSTTTITDGTGKTFTYARPAEHIVTMGYASTLTVAMLGETDKIIAVDTYSTYNYTKDERLAGLNALNLGSIYTSSNNDNIVAQLVQLVGKGKMSLGDTIILTTYSNALTLRDLLNGIGFDHVLVYGVPTSPITSYEQVKDFISDISVIVKGDTSSLVGNMEAVENTVINGLKGTSERPPALFVWYNKTSGYSVGNTGSIAVSLIEAAGGTNIAYSPNSATTYGDKNTIVQLVESHPNTIIFLQDTYIKDGHTVGDFRNDVLGGDAGIPIVIVDSKWNNYDTDAASGLWVFACALHPEIFQGAMPSADGSSTLYVIPIQASRAGTVGGSSSSDLALYAIAGLLVGLIILGFAYFYLRRP
ncbi:corrinoid ABC transporter substrate-binding protein [Candidatus Methanoplasma termitum]|uniref:Corrinoid ABC transporter substrate-binding protein n=1 Tax=Candidatus Methanoplasma termitum TaxID=1577791 RepID=A0A0A7LC70_9ARCH|nr:hypothetical protein [Candidatus Methanoplasma termitum]AIZ56654.1 corrinoid ABC transporter substrate-binding protein [Candidatus Methanoplasma termitum]